MANPPSSGPSSARDQSPPTTPSTTTPPPRHATTHRPCLTPAIIGDLAGVAPGSRPSSPAVARTRGSLLRTWGAMAPSARLAPHLERGRGVIHGHGGGRTVLSQSEDQNRPHPVLTFVHPMSTQVRGPGPGAAESAHCSDPQTATRTRTRPADRRKTIQGTAYNHSNPRHERPGTPTPANQSRSARITGEGEVARRGVTCLLSPVSGRSGRRTRPT